MTSRCLVISQFRDELNERTERRVGRQVRSYIFQTRWEDEVGGMAGRMGVPLYLILLVISQRALRAIYSSLPVKNKSMLLFHAAGCQGYGDGVVEGFAS